MVRCPNCGQKTSGDYCQWCQYPILKGRATMRRKTLKWERKQAEQQARETAKRDAEEARKTKKPEGKTERETEEVVGGELYEGIAELAIVSPVDLGQLRKLEEYLRQAQDLRLEMIAGSVNEGTKIVVSVTKSIPLIDVLREMPPVEQVVKEGNKIRVRLKAKV